MIKERDNIKKFQVLIDIGTIKAESKEKAKEKFTDDFSMITNLKLEEI